MVKADRYSIVNILAGKDVVGELIQRDFHAEGLTREALRLLDSPQEREAMIREFRRIRAALGSSRASRRAAEELGSLLRGRGSSG